MGKVGSLGYFNASMLARRRGQKKERDGLIGRSLDVSPHDQPVTWGQLFCPHLLLCHATLPETGSGGREGRGRAARGGRK